MDGDGEDDVVALIGGAWVRGDEGFGDRKGGVGDDDVFGIGGGEATTGIGEDAIDGGVGGSERGEVNDDVSALTGSEGADIGPGEGAGSDGVWGGDG